MTIPESPATINPREMEDDLVNSIQSTKIAIPKEYQGLPSEVVEEIWQPAQLIDTDQNKEIQETRKQVLSEIRQQEAAREQQKTAHLIQEFGHLNQKHTSELPQVQENVGQMLLDHFQGINRLDDILKPEEAYVLQKMEESYRKAKEDYPDKSVAFQFNTPLDQEIYKNLTWRMMLENLKSKSNLSDQHQANTLREQLNIPTKKIETYHLVLSQQEIKQLNPSQETTSPENPEQPNDTKQLNPESAFPYHDLANVKQAEQALLQILTSGKPDWRAVSSIIYKMLTTRSEAVRMIQEAGNDATVVAREHKPEVDGYKALKQVIGSTLGEDFDINDTGAWFGINTHPEAGIRKGINRKAYLTLPIEEANAIQYLPSLAQNLRELSLESDDVIQVKIPSGWNGFMYRNDSIVVHFKKPENSARVQELLEQWLTQNNIKEEPREMARTKLAADSKTTSFSDEIAQNISHWLEQNYGQFDNQLLSDLSLKYAIEQSQNPPEISLAA